MEPRPRVVRDIVFMLHNMLKTHQGEADKTPSDVTAQQNEQAMYVPNENYRNPSREAKHQQEPQKDYFNHVRSLSGQKDRI